MKFSNFFIPTLREVPTDAIIKSHILMLRAGMIKQLTSGVYSYLPLGNIVFKKIEQIVREEMNAIGGNEFLLPALSPNELYAQSGRLFDFGDDIFLIKNRELVLAPTHEEVFTSIAKPNLISYKNLPQIWYQIQTKFRNEPRPRGGVLRARQFIMKDSYSFDTDWKGLDVSYQKHDQAYKNIFTRCGLKFFKVLAFSGAMGGSQSEEFMVETEAGEDNVVISEDKSYASNLEVAVSFIEPVGRIDSNLMVEELYTPNVKSIDVLAGFLNFKEKSRLAKSRVFVVPAKNSNNENKIVLALVCGDDEFNEPKLQNIYPGIRPAHPDELVEITGADAGSIGPIGLKVKNLEIISDLRLRNANELISGANKNDYHIKNIDLVRDVKNVKYYDIRIVKEGESTADRKSTIKITKAIEVGHIFKLGTKYSEALSARYLDENGKENVLVMGSYGIGIERIAASYIEQNCDNEGIIWTGEIAPFTVEVICINSKSYNIKEDAQKIYDLFIKSGIEVLYDDRNDVSPGVKFKDADLIGISIQLIISEKNMKYREIEVKIRRSGERTKVPFDNIHNVIREIITKAK